MTAVVSFDRTDLDPAAAPPPPPTPGPDRRPETGRRRARERGRGSLRWCWLPAAVSVSVNAVFLVAWWAPEFGEFAGRDALLGQLWPLAAKELTSAGQPVVAEQAGQSGLLAGLLLLTSIMLPFLSRSRSRSVRVILPAAAVYVGILSWVVAAVQLLRGAGGAWSGSVLLTAWVVAAAVTCWRSRFVAPAELPSGRLRVGWLVAVVALLYPLPLALGRALFAPQVGDAARSLLAADPTRQLATLATVSSVLAYLAGMAVVVTLWSLYLLVPPYPGIRVPWAHRRPFRVDPLVTHLGVTVLSVVPLVLLAFPAAEAGRSQARQWLAGNPTGDQLACANWVEVRPGRPTATLVSGGDQCRELSTYAGYTPGPRVELPTTVSPVKATMPDRRPITSRTVSARYGAVVVLAGTGAVDAVPDELFGISLDTAGTSWRFRCDDDGAMRLRFAGADPVPGATPAAELAAGHLSTPGEQPAVVVECTNQSLRLDPATGRPTS